MSEEFEASDLSGTRIVSSHSPVSSNSTAPLSPDHTLSYVSPTPTPTRVSFYRRTARMAVRTQPSLSPGMSARIVKIIALSLYSFCKRYRSSYETSSSSYLTLLVRKRYRGTSELILDTDSEEDELREEDTEEDESSDADDEREDDEGQGLEDEGPNMKEEEEASPEAKHRALESTEKIAPSTYEVGQSSKSVPEQEGFERIFAFRQPTLVIWVDPEDNRVYTDIPTYVPLAALVQTPSSLEWFRSLEWEQERATMTFSAIWRLILALEAWAGQNDA
ncbi:hypothetical protein Tco_0850676 [Tanacetum coccineum]